MTHKLFFIISTALSIVGCASSSEPNEYNDINSTACAYNEANRTTDSTTNSSDGAMISAGIAIGVELMTSNDSNDSGCN